MLRGQRGNIIIRAVPILAGVIAVMIGLLWLPTSMSTGLIAIGAGIALAGVGGSLSIVTPSGRLSGIAGGVLIIVGVVVAYLPRG
jgi:hypothetical protein